MEGSCAVRQGDTTTTTARGLTAGGGGDVDALNVEHDLARWLRDLDTSVCRFIDLLGGTSLRH